MSQGGLVALGGLEDFLPFFLSFAVLFLLCSSSLSSFELSRSPKSSSMPLTSVSFWCFLHPVHRTLHSLLKMGTWFDSQHVLNNLSACSPSLNENWLARLHFHESTGTQNCAVRGPLSSLKFGFSTTIEYSLRQSTLQREKQQPRTAQCGVPVNQLQQPELFTIWMAVWRRSAEIYSSTTGFTLNQHWTWGKKRTSSKECFWCFEACIWVHGASNGNDPEMPWSRMVGNLVFWFPTCPPSRFKELLPALASSKTMA